MFGKIRKLAFSRPCYANYVNKRKGFFFNIQGSYQLYLHKIIHTYKLIITVTGASCLGTKNEGEGNQEGNVQLNVVSLASKVQGRVPGDS